MRRTFIVILMVILSVALSAQMREQQGGKFKRPMERLENYKKIRMIEVLKLDEETGLKLVSRYNKHREGVKQLEQNRAAVIDKLESQLSSNASDAELQKTFAEFHDSERKIGESRKKFLDDLKEVLTVKQIGEYIIFERNFMADLRNVVKDVQNERRRRE
jgi:Spy/CpxP family protein refolding chaperone